MLRHHRRVGHRASPEHPVLVSGYLRDYLDPEPFRGDRVVDVIAELEDRATAHLSQGASAEDRAEHMYHLGKAHGLDEAAALILRAAVDQINEEGLG